MEGCGTRKSAMVREVGNSPGFQTSEVHALDFGRDEEALGLLAEQENGLMAGAVAVEQVEMSQGPGRRRLGAKRVPALGFGNLIKIEIVRPAVGGRLVFKEPDIESD